jgi:hypothetical protein
MSSESSIDSIFQALKVLQAEVRGLAFKLQSAEERISRLEEATFTPSPSPNPTESSNHSSVSYPIEQTVSPCQSTKPPPAYRKSGISSTTSDTEDIRSDESNATPASICRHSNQPSAQLNSDAVRACDLEQQLLPIKDGIANLAQHLSKVEGYLLHSTSSPTHQPTASPRNSNDFGRREVFVNEQISTNPTSSSFGSGSPRLKAQSKAQTQQHRVDGPHTVLGLSRQEDKSLGRPSIVFGQPSTPTPRKTKTRLNVEKSPFTKYANPTSPFYRLRTKKDGLTPSKA